jgi:hypothetical protein
MGIEGVTEMRWPVAASYVIEYNKWHGSGGLKKELRTTSAEVARWYNPLDERRLPREFARVIDDQSLLAFAHKYGELGYHFIGDIITRPEYYENRTKLTGEPVDWTLRHANQVRVFLWLYDGLLKGTMQAWAKVDENAALLKRVQGQRPDWSMLPQSLGKDLTEAVRELRRTTPGVTIERGKAGSDTTMTTVITLTGGESVYGEDFNTGSYGNDDIALVHRLVHAIVNENTRAVMVALQGVADEKGRPSHGRTLQCDSLLEAIYYHLRTALEQFGVADEPRQCRTCQTTFQSPDRRKHFCSNECKRKYRREYNRRYQAGYRSDPKRKERKKEDRSYRATVK